MALQLMMTPEFIKGMTILRYVNNHASTPDTREKYFPNGDVVCCLAGIMQLSVCFMCIALNTYLMSTYNGVTTILKHFLSMKVAIWIPKLTFGAMEDKTITKVYDANIAITEHPDQIDFGDRTCFHKIMRILYKIIRCFHLCVLYYFMPFAIMMIQNMLVNGAGGYNSDDPSQVSPRVALVCD